MNRKELEDSILWSGGGAGFGLCSVAASMSWAMDEPTKDKPDLISIVSLGLPKEKYTDEELAKIVKFAKRKTANYDKMFRYRRGANLIMFDKQVGEKDTRWLRKRLSWEIGPMFSPTLDEAIALMLEK